MVGNAVTKTNAAGDIRPDKQKATGKIDGVVASIMATGLANMNPVSSGSYLEDGPATTRMSDENQAPRARETRRADLTVLGYFRALVRGAARDGPRPDSWSRAAILLALWIGALRA
jgi:hypothetical protein